MTVRIEQGDSLAEAAREKADKSRVLSRGLKELFGASRVETMALVFLFPGGFPAVKQRNLVKLGGF